MKDRKYPTWVTMQEQCMWCSTMSKLAYAGVNETKDGVEMVYICENPECDHISLFHKPNKIVALQSGKKSVDVFLKKMAEASPSKQKKKPEEIEV